MKKKADPEVLAEHKEESPPDQHDQSEDMVGKPATVGFGAGTLSLNSHVVHVDPCWETRGKAGS